MRKFVALFIAFIFISQAFINLGITIYWLSNHAYIATTLCKNKDKPSENCNGKCYLKKQIATSTDNCPKNNSHLALKLKKGLELAEFPTNSVQVFLFANISNFPKLIEGTQTCRGTLFRFSVFRPPSATLIA
jgi:hypothetical protein